MYEHNGVSMVCGGGLCYTQPAQHFPTQGYTVQQSKTLSKIEYNNYYYAL